MRSETEQSAHVREQPSTGPAINTRTAATDSRTLFGNAEILYINHQGLTYTLRKTRNGKLILTK